VLRFRLRRARSRIQCRPWIKHNYIAEAFLVGSRAQTTTVTAYLGRPIYYLECGELFIVWNNITQSYLSAEELARRLTKAIASAGRSFSSALGPSSPEKLIKSSSEVEG
jgi:hypothetical protein